MAGIKVLGTEQFEDFSRRAKAMGSEGKKLRNEMRRSLQEGAKPIVDEAQSNVKGVSSRGGGGGARAARTAFLLSKRKKSLSTRAKAKIHASTGLRSSAARATKLQVTMSGNTARARVRVHSAMMPADQRKLPLHMNTGKWRHPVMGGPAWVTQTVAPDRWFDRAADTRGPKARDHAVKSVGEFLEKF